MKDNVLVAYASKCGSTREVAEAVGKVLAQAGAAVDVKRVQDAKDLKSYNAVLLGTALRMEKPLPEAVRFAKKHRAALCAVPVACFSVGLAMKQDTPENREKTKRILTPLLDELQSPVSVGLFGGKLDYTTLPAVFRWMFSQDTSGELAEGDWRDWKAIDAWTKDLIPLL
jgi:menaquinone-dependent protoporphyrinogen oxidase